MDKFKEEMYEALSYLFEHAHSCTDCADVNIGCDTCERDNTMECDIAHSRLSNLIESYIAKEKLANMETEVLLNGKCVADYQFMTFDNSEIHRVRIIKYKTRLYKHYMVDNNVVSCAPLGKVI